MKKIIFILLSIFSILSFSDEYKIIADYNVKISKTEQENSSVEIEKVIKKEFSQDKMIKEFLQYEPKEYQEYYASKWDVITKNIQKLSEEETKKTIADFNSAMAEVVDEKLAATVKYSYVDYTVELIKKGNSWEILDIKQLNK